MAGLRIADRERSAEPARRLGCAVLGCAVLGCAVLGCAVLGWAVLGCAEVVRVAAREQDDIAAAHVLDVPVCVDPEHEFAGFDDVQAADIGEADREGPQRSVRHDPFSAQPDAPEQLREQVVRLAVGVEAEHGFLKRWRIGKLLRRLGQIGWRRWTIGKMSRRIGHGRCPSL